MNTNELQTYVYQLTLKVNTIRYNNTLKQMQENINRMNKLLEGIKNVK